MGTLQSQLAQVIKSWDDETPSQPATTMTTPTATSLSERLFNQIRDGAPLTRAEAIHVFCKRNAGAKKATMSALLTQFLRSGLVKYESGYVKTTVPAYVPNAITKARSATKLKHKQIQITRRPSSNVPSEKLSAPAGFNADAFVNRQLTLTQAKAVYVYLSQVFGN